MTGAREILESMEGRNLISPSGRKVKIVGFFEESFVFVKTRKFPSAPVLISKVQKAIDDYEADGTLIDDKGSFYERLLLATVQKELGAKAVKSKSHPRRPSIDDVVVEPTDVDGAERGSVSLTNEKQERSPKSRRQPPFRDEELILILEHYLNGRDGIGANVDDLSEALSSLEFHADLGDEHVFRSIGSVERALRRFRFLADSQTTASDMPRGKYQRIAGQFSSEPEKLSLRSAQIQGISSGGSKLSDEQLADRRRVLQAISGVLDDAHEESADSLPDASPLELRSRENVWMRDELILVLDLYFENDRNPTSDLVSEMSQLLRSIPVEQYLADDLGFRNEASVRLKLSNLSAVHTHEKDAVIGRDVNEDRDVWDEFASDPQQLSRIAAQIRLSIENPLALGEAADADDVEDAPEGRLLTRVHRTRERNQKLVKRKKQLALKESGELVCECCGFDFYAVYGGRGHGFIECHHKVPVSGLKEGHRTRVEDLALLCSNCHRMIHRQSPWLSVEALRETVGSQSASGETGSTHG